MHVFRQVSNTQYDVGYFEPGGTFYVVQTCPTQSAACRWVHYLNGGDDRDK